MGETAQKDGKATGFWHTLPGVITAVAALLTALGGFLGILVQNGVIGWGDGSQSTASPDDAGVVDARDGDRPSSRGSTPAEASVTGEPTPEDAAAGAAPGSADPSAQPGDLVPWDRATAELVRRDGTSTQVKASTVSLNCDVEKMRFENGQELSLELVQSIRYDAIYLDSASADGLVTLWDGRELTDPIYTWNCPVGGQNDLGRVQVKLEDIRRVEFHR